MTLCRKCVKSVFPNGLLVSWLIIFIGLETTDQICEAKKPEPFTISFSTNPYPSATNYASLQMFLKVIGLTAWQFSGVVHAETLSRRIAAASLLISTTTICWPILILCVFTLIIFNYLVYPTFISGCSSCSIYDYTPNSSCLTPDLRTAESIRESRG